jgi:inward rectifier potassium channel
MHPIDPESPLYGKTLEALDAEQAELMATLIGMDGELSQTIHARRGYLPEDLRFNHRFKDVLSTNAEGRRQLDYRVFHQSEPLPETPAKA